MSDSPYSDGMNEHDQLREAVVRINELERQVKELTFAKQAYKRKLDRLQRVVADVCEAVADEMPGCPNCD